ncbi:MAG: LamG domain-containing protein [Thermoguttaceae bacterium]|nr:LamG domain-containing protein [Thermoguttaceae bacterium]
MKNFQNVTLRFCALIAALALFAQSVQADPVLRGYWTFDNDTVDSGTITESAGYVEAGTHIGLIKGTGVAYNPIVNEPGNHLNSGNYISFTDNTYAVIQNTSTVADLDSPNYLETYDFKGASFTISAWVKGLPDANWEPYISKYGENNYGYQLRREAGNSHPTFTYRRSGGDDDPVPNIKGAYTNLNDGEWHNLVAVYGGTYRELYMDGQLITRIPDTVESAGGEGEPLVFSGRYNASSAAYEAFANISLDNVAIYSGALRNNQVTYISNGGDPTQIADVAAGTKTINIGLNSMEGSDGVTYTRSGNISRNWLDEDIHFDGSSYLRTNLPVGSAGMNGSFTASAWVKLEGDSLAGDKSIFGNNATGNGLGLHLIVRDAHPHMGFYGNDLQASNVTLTTGEWYYLTWQYDADNQTQKIYLGGEEIASRTGAAAFAGTNVLDIGTSMGGGYLNGNVKGISITDGVLTADQIKAQMNAPATPHVENFDWGKNTNEWYNGGGASLGNLHDYGTFKALSMYHAPDDAAEKTIYEQANSDVTTGMLWGPTFTVASDAPADTVFSVDVVGGNAALDVTSRGNGGAGVALWDLTTGDYVRDADNNVLYGNGNSSDTPKHTDISLDGRQGHNLVVVAIDRSTGGWGWAGPSQLTVDANQVSAIADAAQHHIVLNDFNFDTAGEFSGMYEIDADGNRLPSVTNFTNGNRGNGDVTNYYVDSSGTFDNGNKGFLSSGSNGQEETPTGVLRSDPFLVQGDIMEYYISGGNNINNKHLDLVDADSGEVYRSATGNDTNDFKYDFWSLKGLEGKSVYIQVVDSDGGTSWSHLELDQIRQIKFAPTAAEVAAANNSLKSRNLPYYEVEPGFNADSYNLEGTGIDSLAALADYITGGAEPTNKDIQLVLDNYKADEGAPVGVNVLSVLNVASSGMYTLAVGNDEPYKITLNGSTIFESEGSADLEFIPLLLSEVGQYALNMLYLDQSDEGASLYLAEGGYDAWNSAFSLLAGYGDGYVLAYAQNVDPNKIPEPSTWALLILGAAGLLYWRKRK